MVRCRRCSMNFSTSSIDSPAYSLRTVRARKFPMVMSPHIYHLMVGTPNPESGRSIKSQPRKLVFLSDAWTVKQYISNQGCPEGGNTRRSMSHLRSTACQDQPYPISLLLPIDTTTAFFIVAIRHQMTHAKRIIALMNQFHLA